MAEIFAACPNLTRFSYGGRRHAATLPTPWTTQQMLPTRSLVILELFPNVKYNLRNILALCPALKVLAVQPDRIEPHMPLRDILACCPRLTHFLTKTISTYQSSHVNLRLIPGETEAMIDPSALSSNNIQSGDGTHHLNTLYLGMDAYTKDSSLVWLLAGVTNLYLEVLADPIFIQSKQFRRFSCSTVHSIRALAHLLRHCPYLEELNIHYIDRAVSLLDPEVLNALRAAASHIRSIATPTELTSAQSLTLIKPHLHDTLERLFIKMPPDSGSTLKLLTPFRALVCLSMDVYTPTSCTASYFEAVEQMPALRHIKITALDFPPFKKSPYLHLRNMESIRLINCGFVYYTALEDMISSAPYLRLLELGISPFREMCDVKWSTFPSTCARRKVSLTIYYGGY